MRYASRRLVRLLAVLPGLGPRHVEFTWNNQGLQGPQGAPGEAGPAGPAGVSGWELNEASVPVNPPGASISRFCTPGKKMLSGGYAPLAQIQFQYVTLRASYPSPVLQDSWIIWVDVTEPVTVRVWTICASVTS